jgi:hypothetical protein
MSNNLPSGVLTGSGPGVAVGFEISQSDVRYCPFHISRSERKKMQSVAMRALAPEILAPSFDKNAGICFQMVLNLSFGRGAKEFERNERTHNR